MRKRLWLIPILSLWVLACLVPRNLQATPLSIYDIQYTTHPSGDSPYADSTIDCEGGLVINKWVGGRVKLTIWDPDYASAWGAVIVKDLSNTGAFDAVEVGDWVSFTAILVEERGGNTQLSYLAGSSLTRNDNPGIALPAPLEIADPQFSEPYESMLVHIPFVEVTALDLGPYNDNYNLHNTNGDYWASDYMNVDTPHGAYYHPAVGLGNAFDSVSGIIEHKIKDEYDFYQLLTLDSGSFVPEPATIWLMLAAVAVLRRRPR